MTETQANAVAAALGGLPWQPYPGLCMVLVPRDNGSLVVVDGERVSEYRNAEDLEAGEPVAVISLREGGIEPETM